MRRGPFFPRQSPREMSRGYRTSWTIGTSFKEFLINEATFVETL